MRLSSRALQLLLVSAAFSVAFTARAQGPDRNDLVLDWSRGRYASPVLCEIDGKVARGLRRILITPGPAHQRPPANKLVFVDMQVSRATRCFTELEPSAPNIVGFVYLRHPTRGRYDTAQRDFKKELARKGGFDLEIPEGKLRLTPVGETDEAPSVLDFRGGQARLRTATPGSDAAKLLADFPSPRKMVFELETRDGEILTLPAYLADLR